MKFEKSFQLSTYLLLLTGFLSVLSAGGVGEATTIVYLLVLALSWFLSPFRLTNWQQLVAVVSLVAVFLLDGLVLSEWGIASIRLLLTLSLLKVLTRRSGRDYLQIYLVALALLLVATTFNPAVSYLIISISFLLFSVLTFILFENRRAYRKNRAAVFSLAGNFCAALAIAGLILMFAIPIFLAIPRGAVGLFGADRINVTGFSDEVRLGEMGRILDNERVVMRVKVDWPVRSLPLDLKWRGRALEHFDGVTWSHRGGVGQRIRRDSQGRFLLTRNRRQKELLLEQVFLMEPFSDVVFAAAEAIQISGLGNGQLAVWQDRNDALSVRPIPGKPLRYFVHSDLQTRREKLRRSQPSAHSEARLASYLRLPAMDDRIPEFAKRITEPGDTSIEKAVRIERYLRENFHYTLENPAGGSRDPLASFLFEYKAGHCEYFASAQAVILRTLGIPTRIVNGFRRGEYNDWGSYFIVRASDAHSWLEAYFPTIGWVEFDPTPPAVLENSDRLLRALARMMDAIDVLWVEVVTFDRFKQAGFFELIRTKLRDGSNRLLQAGTGLFETWKEDRTVLWEWVWSLRLPLVFAVSIILVLFLIYLRRHRLGRLLRRRMKRDDETDLARDYYLQMLDLLREKGLVKSRFETPAEFGVRVSRVLGSDLPARITDCYYQTRFGGVLLDAGQLSAVDTLLRQLEQRI